METNANESAAVDPNANMDTSEKMISTDEEFFDDSAQVLDFDNVETEEGCDQRFQASNRGGFR